MREWHYLQAQCADLSMNAGDVWQDNDPRIPNRFLVIREIIPDYHWRSPGVLCEVFVLDYKSDKLTMYLHTGQVKINVQRLRPTRNGYLRRKDLDNDTALHNNG